MVTKTALDSDEMLNVEDGASLPIEARRDVESSAERKWGPEWRAKKLEEYCRQRRAPAAHIRLQAQRGAASRAPRSATGIRCTPRLAHLVSSCNGPRDAIPARLRQGAHALRGLDVWMRPIGPIDQCASLCDCDRKDLGGPSPFA
jgi:hypothetical protein